MICGFRFGRQSVRRRRRRAALQLAPDARKCWRGAQIDARWSCVCVCVWRTYALAVCLLMPNMINTIWIYRCLLSVLINPYATRVPTRQNTLVIRSIANGTHNSAAYCHSAAAVVAARTLHHSPSNCCKTSCFSIKPAHSFAHFWSRPSEPRRRRALDSNTRTQARE